MKKRNFFKLILLLLLPLSIAMMFILSNYPKFVEKVYSSTSNKLLIELLSKISGIIKISIAEIIIIVCIILIIFLLFKLIYQIILSKCSIKTLLKNFFIKIYIALGIIYFAFIILWGINYCRVPFSEIANLKIEPSSVTELSKLCKHLINNANNYKSSIVQKSSFNTEYIFQNAYKGFDAISYKYPQLGGKYGNPKRVIFSKIMSYQGTSGMYFPFTGEANINVDTPLFTTPATVCHEMAHQRGFAREDEANYISYLACTNNPDIHFKYAGTILAVIYSMNALKKYNPSEFNILNSLYLYDVRKDLNDLNNYWTKYEGPIQSISDKINNTYLKINLQKDGIYSYGRMIDLLLAQYKNQ